MRTIITSNHADETSGTLTVEIAYARTDAHLIMDYNGSRIWAGELRIKIVKENDPLSGPSVSPIDAAKTEILLPESGTIIPGPTFIDLDQFQRYLAEITATFTGLLEHEIIELFI